MFLLAAWAGVAQAALAAVFHVDVAVIGAGSAGLSAAIAAHEAGAKVMVFEKMPMVGGNSLRATGYITAVGSALQRSQGLEADPEVLYQDILRMGGETVRSDLARRLVDESGKAVDWLSSLGVDLGRVRMVPGTREYRLLQPATDINVGTEIINGLLCQVEMHGIPVQMDTRVVELSKESGRVSGFRAVSSRGDDMIVKAKAVVLSTGGYASGESLIGRFAPEHVGQVSTNTPGAVGDGLLLAEAVGAGFVDLDELQYHPTAIPLTGRIVPESIRFDGAILVDGRGRRFVNELASSQEVSDAIRSVGGWAWLIGDRVVAASAPQMRSIIMHESVVAARDESELAQRISVPVEQFRATLVDYRIGAARGVDAFGRATFASDLAMSPLYAGRIRPAIHATTGGVSIDRDAQVLDADGKPLPGLYAAGEVTGGVHGRRRLEDIALTDSIVFGLTAGRNAAAFADALMRSSAVPAGEPAN